MKGVRNDPALYEDMHNPWLYCFTNPLEIGKLEDQLTHTADDAKAKHVSQFLED